MQRGWGSGAPQSQELLQGTGDGLGSRLGGTGRASPPVPIHMDGAAGA